MNTLFQIEKVLRARVAREWRRVLEHPRRLIGLFNKAQLVVFGRLAKGHCLAVLSFSREIVRLYRRSGALFVAKYLKQAQVLVLWYISSKGVSPLPKLSVPISLTRSGLPRIIPPMYRKELRRRNALVVKMVITIFAFHRVMVVGRKKWQRVDTSTIDTNFAPPLGTQKFNEIFRHRSSDLLRKYAPASQRIPLRLGFQWEPVFKSGSNTHLRPEDSNVDPSWFEAWKKYSISRFGEVRKCVLTQYHTLPLDIGTAFPMLWSQMSVSVQYTLISDRIYKGIENVTPDFDASLWFHEYLLARARSVCKSIWSDVYDQERYMNGRFGLKLEGAGKVRTFAIPNPFVQSLMRPLHDWLMSVLKSIEMDGTFSQLSPLSRLQSKKELYSFDLKSATDLFPHSLTGNMLASLFGEQMATTWTKVMGWTSFCLTKKSKPTATKREVQFDRGQPLGFLSSWPAFALNHHMVVWLAAEKVLPGRRFKDYALLGDDIVIANKEVAEVYREIMESMGGVINLDKSLISHNGCCEFAKRFYMDYHKEDWRDCSPLSSACLILSHTSLGASHLRTLSCGFVPSFRLKGAGYRVLAKVDRSRPEVVFERLSRRRKRHWLTLYSTSGTRPLPIRLWLKFPYGILDPYEYGQVRWRILESVRPRPIDEKSVELVRPFWGDQDVLFEAILRSFVLSNLRHYHWYCSVLFDYDVPLEELIRPPVGAYRLERKKEDSDVYQSYGIIFRCWDMIRKQPRVLPIGPLNPIVVDATLCDHSLPTSDSD